MREIPWLPTVATGASKSLGTSYDPRLQSKITVQTFLTHERINLTTRFNRPRLNVRHPWYGTTRATRWQPALVPIPKLSLSSSKSPS